MIVHKVNMDLINTEATRIEKEKAARGNLPDLNWHKGIKDGDYIFRLLPPYNATGRIFRPIREHWELAPDKKRFWCLCGTWPEKADSCFFCDGLEKVLAKFPDRTLGRQKSSAKWFMNVIDRADPDKGIQILRITPSIYNWLVLQISDPQIGDITDISEGVDFKITRSSKQIKGRNQVEYTPAFIPRPAPLSQDDEEIAKWLDAVPDLDKVIKYPDDAALSEMNAYASRMVTYYTNLFENQKETQSEDPAPPDQTPPPSEKSEPQKATNKEEALEDADPRAYPSCFAGLKEPVSHDGDGVPASAVGTIGMHDEIEKCMLCEHEMKCLDAKTSKGF